MALQGQTAMLCDFHTVAKRVPVNPQISSKLAARVWTQLFHSQILEGIVGTIINQGVYE